MEEFIIIIIINYWAEINADYSAQMYYIVCIYLDYLEGYQGKSRVKGVSRNLQVF